jgi:hypothetical protein
MPWAKLDDGLTFHAKIIEAGNAATGVWVRGLAWSAFYLTDGHVPSKIARVIAGESRGALAALVRSGLWAECPGGYQIHDYLEYNPSRAEVLEKREKDRIRKGGDSARNSTGVDEASNAPDPVPIPSRSRPDPEEIDLSDLEDLSQIPDDQQLAAPDVEQACFTRYGQLGSTNGVKISRLCPIYGWELKQAARSPGKSWGYFAKVILSIREEVTKPKPPPGAAKGGSEITPEYIESMRKIGREIGVLKG